MQDGLKRRPSRPQRRGIESRKELKPPAALITLTAVNIWVLAFLTAAFTFDWMDARTAREWFAFDPDKPTLSGLILSMFAHAGWMHLIGNMFLLALPVGSSQTRPLKSPIIRPLLKHMVGEGNLPPC